MTLGLFHYQLLSDILEQIHYIYDETELSNTVLAQLSKALNTEGGTIFSLIDEKKITPLASYGTDVNELKKVEFEYGKGVVGWVAQYVQPVKVDNPKSDTRFMCKADGETGFKTKSIIASPILSKGKIIGIIEFLNKKNSSFTVADLELISMIGREIGIAFENVKLIKRIEESRTYLKSIVNGLNAGLIVVNKDDTVPIINPRAAQILKIKANQIEDNKQEIKELSKQAPELFALLGNICSESKTIPRGQMKIQINNSEMILGYSTVPIQNEKGEYSGMTFLFQNITGYINKQTQK